MTDNSRTNAVVACQFVRDCSVIVKLLEAKLVFQYLKTAVVTTTAAAVTV